ncbi:MAG: FliG C-terminal domain-containing protein [Planctomycetota bacterium]
MKLSREGLRKAAILVASLDTAAADAVLDQLTPEQARQVREIVMEMDDIDQGEQRRVIDDFFHVKPKVPANASAGVELDGRLAWLTSRDGPIEPFDAGHSAAPAGQPFHFLRETEAEKLLRVLSSERPQTIALVLSHLLPSRAGAVLARLPENVQAEVIRRLVDLEETDPEILREVEETLQTKLSQQVEMQRRRVAGLQAVAGILQATDSRVGMQILDNLASRDRDLAEKLGPRQLMFDDLADLDESVLAEVFDEAGPELMLPALFGAIPQLVSRVLARIPHADARAIRLKLNHPGPIRLSDVEEARRQVARIASRLNYRVTHRVVRGGREVRS